MTATLFILILILNSIVIVYSSLSEAMKLAGVGNILGAIDKLEPYSEDYDAMKMRANLYYLLENMDEAKKCFLKAIELGEIEAKPGEEVDHMRGRVALIDLDYKSSVHLFERSTNSNSPLAKNAGCVLDYGYALGLCGLRDKAQVYFDRALAIANNSELLFSMIINKWLLMGDLSCAQKSVDRGIKSYPRSGVLLALLGQIEQDKGNLAAAASAYRRSLEVKENQPNVWFNLGTAIAEDPTASYSSCIKAYKSCVQLDPNHIQGWLNLGMSHKAIAHNLLGDDDSNGSAAMNLTPHQREQILQHLNSAYTALKRAVSIVEIKDKDVQAIQSAQHSLAVVVAALVALGEEILEENTPETAASLPTASTHGYLLQEFDGKAADSFNDRLLGRLNYTSHEELASVLQSRLSALTSGWDDKRQSALAILDLGCGTGLTGVALAKLDDVKSMLLIDGVDIAPKMVSLTRRLLCLDGETPVYRSVVQADLLEHLQQQGVKASAYNVVVAADTFIYVGDLSSVFENITTCLSPGGLFAFTTESVDAGPREGVTYRLLLSSRFAHADTYIRNLAKANGFTIEKDQFHSPRVEGGRPVRGRLWLLKKK